MRLFVTVLALALAACGAHATDSTEIDRYVSSLNEKHGVEVLVLRLSPQTLSQLEQLELYLEGALDLPEQSLTEIQCNKPACTGGGGGGGCGNPVCHH